MLAPYQLEPWANSGNRKPLLSFIESLRGTHTAFQKSQRCCRLSTFNRDVWVLLIGKGGRPSQESCSPFDLFPHSPSSSQSPALSVLLYSMFHVEDMFSLNRFGADLEFRRPNPKLRRYLLKPYTPKKNFPCKAPVSIASLHSFPFLILTSKQSSCTKTVVQRNVTCT